MTTRWLTQCARALYWTSIFMVSQQCFAQDLSLKAIPVVDGVWFVQGNAALGSVANHNFISNAGFVVTNEGVVVVDALGSPDLASELLTESFHAIA